MKKQNKKASEPRKKSKGKNALLGDIVRKTVGKIVEKIGKKKPFGGKGGRRKKEPEQI